MGLLRDKDRGFSSWIIQDIPLEVLNESWGNGRGLLGTGSDNFPRFSKCYGRKRHVLGIL